MADGGTGQRSPTGTRFRLFPQPPFLAKFSEPETVWVSPPAGTISAGPADDRMYVIDPIGKRVAYGQARDRFGNAAYLVPPWPGPSYPPALPDADGHFDCIPIDTPEFEAAHLFCAVRRTLDIWERYLGHPVEWHFAPDFDRLELVLQRNLEENAYMGYGFLEVGVHRTKEGGIEPFSLNFDIIAHEVGHCIVYAVLGVPELDGYDAEYYGFHESAADLTALVATLHFDSVVDDLLETTHGNLYTLNYVNRIAELSDNQQIRLAANPLTLLDFVTGWSDEHDLAQPLTGAMFDILVDIFHEELVGRGLISHRAEDLSDRLEDEPNYHRIIQPLFDEAYAANPQGFREALISARDILGTYLAETWLRLSPDNLNYAGVGRALFAVERMMTGGRYRRIIDVNLRRRAIGYARVGPQLEPQSSKSHFDLPRIFVPPLHGDCSCRRLSYREKLNDAWQGSSANR